MTQNADVPPDAEQLERAYRAKEDNRYLLLSRPNVIGLDVGIRVRGGEATDEYVVKVYVSQKVDDRYLSDEQRLPDTVRVDESDVGVDVEEAVIPAPGLFTRRSRPLRGGSSLGISPNQGAGTLGVCVTLDDGNTYVLSCNHVLAGSNTVALGTNIVQPSISDGGNDPEDVVATLATFVPIDFGSTTISIPFPPITVTIPNPNDVDVAIGRVTSFYNVGNREVHWIGYPRVQLAGAPSFLQQLALVNKRVCKMGRTSDFTTGTIISPFADSTVGPYPNVGSNAYFRNQLKIQGDNGRPFAQAGDSGSLVVSLDDSQPLGLLFAAGGNLGWANPIDKVMASLTIPRI